MTNKRGTKSQLKSLRNLIEGDADNNKRDEDSNKIGKPSIPKSGTVLERIRRKELENKKKQPSLPQVDKRQSRIDEIVLLTNQILKENKNTVFSHKKLVQLVMDSSNHVEQETVEEAVEIVRKGKKVKK